MPICKVSSGACRDKALSIVDKSHFYSLASQTQAFMDAVKRLPTGARIKSAAQRILDQNEKRCWKAFQVMAVRLQSTTVDHSQTFRILMCLSRVGLHIGGIGQAVVSYVA